MNNHSLFHLRLSSYLLDIPLANDTAEGFVQRMRVACPSFDEMFFLHHQLHFLFPKS